MDKKPKPIFQRVLLKLSGEALQSSDQSAGISPAKLALLADDITGIVDLGVQVAIVVGGGNILRGASNNGFDRVTADQMGMLATIINGLALRDALAKKHLNVQIMSAIGIPGLVDSFDRFKAKKTLKKGKVLIFTAGTGNPLVTTDSAAAIRGVEINADIILKATKVDGVFAADPIKNPKAERYTQLTYDEVLEQRLGVMDLNAILLCKDNGLPLRVFNMSQPGSLQNILLGEPVGTLIKDGG